MYTGTNSIFGTVHTTCRSITSIKCGYNKVKIEYLGTVHTKSITSIKCGYNKVKIEYLGTVHTKSTTSIKCG
jgi:hypothetical protein